MHVTCNIWDIVIQKCVCCLSEIKIYLPLIWLPQAWPTVSLSSEQSPIPSHLRREQAFGTGEPEGQPSSAWAYSTIFPRDPRAQKAVGRRNTNK